MPVRPIPEGYHSVTPMLVVKGAGKLIDFLKMAFGAEEAFRMPTASGEISHAEIRIGDSIVMLNDAFGQPPTASSLFLYVNDADAVYQSALNAGATSVTEPTDMFWGDRLAQVQDQFGNQWSIATHKEDVPPQELERRAEAAMRQHN